MDLREERFRRLYDTGRSRVTAYVLRRITNHEDAADVVAETFAIAWRRLEDIPGGEREVPWLLAVARKVIANRLRGTTSQNTVVERLARQLALSTPGEGDPGPGRLAALAALSRVSEDDREILMLAAWDGLSSQELGWALSCSPTAARIRLHRARVRLDAEWADVRVATSSTSPRLQEAPEL